MAAAKSKYAPVKTGSDPRSEANNKSSWLRIDPNTQTDVVALVDADEIVSCEQCAIWLEDGNSPVWVYTGPEDPSHELKLDRRYRAYLPILVTDTKEVQVWSMGKAAHSMLLDIADATGELKGLELRIKRTGSGLATRYSIVSRGKRHKVDSIEEVDVISMLGPLTPDEVKAMLAEKLGFESYNDVVERYRSKKSGKPSSTSATRKPARAKGVEEEERVVVDDDDEEDLDDVELM